MLQNLCRSITDHVSFLLLKSQDDLSIGQDQSTVVVRNRNVPDLPPGDTEELPHWRIQEIQQAWSSPDCSSPFTPVQFSFRCWHRVARLGANRVPGGAGLSAPAPCPARLASSHSTRAQRPPQPRGFSAVEPAAGPPRSHTNGCGHDRTGGRANPRPKNLRQQGGNRDGRAAGKRRRLRARIA